MKTKKMCKVITLIEQIEAEEKQMQEIPSLNTRKNKIRITKLKKAIIDKMINVEIDNKLLDLNEDYRIKYINCEKDLKVLV